MYDDVLVLSTRCTTTPTFSLLAYDDAAEATAAWKEVEPSSGKTGMERLSPIEEASAEGSRSPQTSRSGQLEHELAAPPAEMSWYAPLRPMTSAMQEPEDLIDLTTDTNPFSGFRPSAPTRSVRASTTPTRDFPPPSTQKESLIHTESLDFLSGAGFKLDDPALAPFLQSPAVVSALAGYLEQALVTQEKEFSTASPAQAAREGRREGSVVTFADEVNSQTTAGHGSAPRALRHPTASAAPSYRPSVHRLPEGIVGGLSFDRPLGPDDRGSRQAHVPQGKDGRLGTRSPARSLIVLPRAWSHDAGGPRGPAPPGVQFDPQLMQAPTSVAGSYGTSHASQGGNWYPRIEPSTYYSGGPSRDHYEAFVYDMERVFNTYPVHVPETSNISVLAGRLQGDALIFFNSKDYYRSDWQTVCEELQARFLPLATPEVTWHNFWKVMQYDQKAKKERPIIEVIQELEALQLRIGSSCNQEIMLNRLWGTFSDGMRTAMLQVRADTYDELRENALQTDQRRRQIQDSREERAFQTAPVRERLAADGQKKRAWTATQVLTHASDVGSSSSPAGRLFRTAATNNKGVKLTAEQLSHHLKSNLCFGCSRPGHPKADCPRRQQASSNHSELAHILDEDDDHEGGTAEAHGVSLIDSSSIKRVDGGESMALPLKLMIRIGGKLAYTLVDNGCTHNLIKPSFIKLHQLAYHRYSDPLALKQTTVG